MPESPLASRSVPGICVPQPGIRGPRVHGSAQPGQAHPPQTISVVAPRRLAVGNGVESSVATRGVWLRFDYSTPQRLSGTNTLFSRSIVHSEVDCTTRSARELALRLYDANNQSMLDHDFEAASWHRSDAPGMSPELYNPLCAWGWPSSPDASGNTITSRHTIAPQPPFHEPRISVRFCRVGRRASHGGNPPLHQFPGAPGLCRHSAR
jgi:hypothetical protein